MTSNRLFALKSAFPFVPFRLYLLDGTRLDVRHAKLLVLHGSDLAHVWQASDPDGDIHTSKQLIELADIDHAEPLAEIARRKKERGGFGEPGWQQRHPFVAGTLGGLTGFVIAMVLLALLDLWMGW